MRQTRAIHQTKPAAKTRLQAAELEPEKDPIPPNSVWQSLALTHGAVHSKLAVSEPGDRYEQEAERIAERVMRMPESPTLTSSQTASPQNEYGRPLDAITRSFFESRFEHDFGNVRIHTGSYWAHQASLLQANAFTVGANIVFNEGRFQPHTSAGRRLIAHELAHVVQQSSPHSFSSGIANHTPSLQIQRDTFQRVPAEAPRTPAEIRAMTVADFQSLATRQLDWFTSPHLNVPAAAADLAFFRQILDFSREPGILSTCGNMVVDALITEGVPAVFVSLRTYARGANASARTTAWLRTTNNAATAAAWGRDLSTIEAESDPGTLRLAMPPPDQIANQSPFEQLVARGFVADFVNYLHLVHPVLSATDGWEIFSYVLLRQGVDPVTYLGRVNFVRDYHHFTRLALDQLVINEAVTTAQQQVPATRKPLTLVLHTTIDHNHAFHQTDGMTALIRDGRMLTIVLEGLPTLADYRLQLHPIASRYGIGGRISQVLIAGHGNFNVVGLAGSVAAGVVTQERLQNMGAPLEVNRTRDLINALVAEMDADPARRRIALAACLTASHHVPAGTAIDPNNPALASAQIRNAITASPNIRDFIETLVGPGTVIGVRASQPAQTFLDANGRLTLNVPDDPQIMGTIVEYVEFGTEPEGALRAVVEGWAADHAGAPPATLTRDAINRRLVRVGGRRINWYEEVIRGLYERVVNQYWSNGDVINQFTGLAGFLAHLFWPDVHSNQATGLWNAIGNRPPADVDAIFTRLTTSGLWANDRRIRLILYQVWMRHIAAHRGDFLNELGQYASCGEAAPYIDMNVVRPEVPFLLTNPPPAVPDPGQLRVAIMEAIARPLPSPAPAVLPVHVQFLRSLLGVGPNFPAALNMGAVTAGFTNESAVLDAIGRSLAGAAPPPAGPVPAAELPRANVDLNRNGMNDFYLTPMARTGTVFNCHFLHVRSRPWMGENIRDVIAAGTPVRIVGSHRGWYGIEHRGRVRFVHSNFIQLAP